MTTEPGQVEVRAIDLIFRGPEEPVERATPNLKCGKLLGTPTNGGGERLSARRAHEHAARPACALQLNLGFEYSKSARRVIGRF